MRSNFGMVCKPAPLDVAGLSFTDVCFSELDDIVSAHCETHELIDNTLRSYLHFTTNYRGKHAE